MKIIVMIMTLVMLFISAESTYAKSKSHKGKSSKIENKKKIAKHKHSKKHRKIASKKRVPKKKHAKKNEKIKQISSRNTIQNEPEMTDAFLNSHPPQSSNYAE